MRGSMPVSFFPLHLVLGEDRMPIMLLDSHKVLPDIFNKGFERREKRAKGVLVEVLKEQGVGR